MPKPKQPRAGSMQFWPRKRAKKSYVRVRSYDLNGEGIQAFAGFKMGMTHVKAVATHKTAKSKNEPISIPCTIIECPPMRIFSVRGYTSDSYGLKVAKEVIVGKDKHLGRKVTPSKKTGDASALDSSFDSPEIVEIRVILMTQPSKTGIGQKKPQLFEVAVGGKTNADKLAVIKEFVGKEIKASEVFKEGDYLDLHAISKGYGYQGPVKRFGISLKSHKSEKGVRRPGSLGGWVAQQHTMYRTAMAGQMGYHQRVQYNNQILKISDKPEEVNVKGGFINYGVGKQGNEFLVIRGSVPGPKKRMITLVKPVRLKRPVSGPTVEEIDLNSKQRK